MFSFLNPEKKAFIKDIDTFFTIDDLSELENTYHQLISKYGLQKIQKYYKKQKFPKTEQGKANLLFHPEILDPKTRLMMQKMAILKTFGDYVFLAAVAGLQGVKFKNINNYGFFVNELGRYLDMIRDQNLAAPFFQVIATRIAITLLYFPSILTFHGIHKVIIPLLENPDFKLSHHNLLLLIVKHESPSFFSDTLEKGASSELVKEIKEMKKIFDLKEDQLNNEQKLKKTIHYSAIPDLKMFNR